MTRTRSTTAGLILFGLLSLPDVASLLLTDGEQPPLVIGVISTVLGLASLGLVVLAWCADDDGLAGRPAGAVGGIGGASLRRT